jgi:hypothetical protein
MKPKNVILNVPERNGQICVKIISEFCDLNLSKKRRKEKRIFLPSKKEKRKKEKLYSNFALLSP